MVEFKDMFYLLAPKTVRLQMQLYYNCGIGSWRTTVAIRNRLGKGYNYSLRTVQRELAKLQKLGLVKSRPVFGAVNELEWQMV